MQIAEVYTDWLVIEPVSESKEGFIVPMEGNVGTVLKTGIDCDPKIKALEGKTIYFGSDSTRFKVKGKVFYVMKASNLFFAEQ